MTTQTVEAFWQQFLATLPPDTPFREEGYGAEQFGDSADVANRLARLIVDGMKTATCSALWEWEAEGASITEVGQKTIVLDGNGEPLCILETTEVAIRPYDQVDAHFAAEEGEGDQSLSYWRTAHWNYFSRSLPKIGKQPTQDMPLVCERFRVIYRELPSSLLQPVKNLA